MFKGVRKNIDLFIEYYVIKLIHTHLGQEETDPTYETFRAFIETKGFPFNQVPAAFLRKDQTKIKT